MIIAERKQFDEIKEKVQDYNSLLILGCGTCVSVCLAGGEKEVELLATQLRMANQLENKDVKIGEATIQRQCDREYIEPIIETAKEYDAVLSMACGAGVQLTAEMLESVPVTPALNTCFIGITEAEGVWAERCRACGICILDKTGGICPIARCAKGLLNGPCGGSEEGKCEINPNQPCAWHLIIERLTKIGKLDELEEVLPPKDWSVSLTGGPPR
ncbi:methylenetetrahydrofolate reductase C-terminal domain-containing protein [Chloroflexota bacterium]